MERKETKHVIRERVIGVIDDSIASSEAIRAAIAHCLAHGNELELVGVITESRFDPPQPAVGERLWRFQWIEHLLVQAGRSARHAGVQLVGVRFTLAYPTEATLHEQTVERATRIFRGRRRTRLRALVARRPRIEVDERLLLPGRGDGFAPAGPSQGRRGPLHAFPPRAATSCDLRVAP